MVPAAELQRPSSTWHLARLSIRKQGEQNREVGVNTPLKIVIADARKTRLGGSAKSPCCLRHEVYSKNWPVRYSLQSRMGVVVNQFENLHCAVCMHTRMDIVIKVSESLPSVHALTNLPAFTPSFLKCCAPGILPLVFVQWQRHSICQ